MLDSLVCLNSISTVKILVLLSSDGEKVHYFLMSLYIKDISCSYSVLTEAEYITAKKQSHTIKTQRSKKEKHPVPPFSTAPPSIMFTAWGCWGEAHVPSQSSQSFSFLMKLLRFMRHKSSKRNTYFTEMLPTTFMLYKGMETNCNQGLLYMCFIFSLLENKFWL